MTDKEQIIIDGVDVSGCLFYQSNFEEDYDVRIKHFCSNWHNCCKSSNNQNCYFKQLARKTQEYERLKEDYKELEQRHNGAFQDFERLKQECEELKEENQELRNSLSDSLMFKFTGQENETNRYRKALEEIEKVCIEDTRIFADGTEVRYDSLDKILDIINKVKEKED